LEFCRSLFSRLNPFLTKTQELSYPESSSSCHNSICSGWTKLTDNEFITGLFVQCTKCESVTYCSNDCLVEDLKRHQPNCYQDIGKAIPSILPDISNQTKGDNKMSVSKVTNALNLSTPITCNSCDKAIRGKIKATCKKCLAAYCSNKCETSTRLQHKTICTEVDKSSSHNKKLQKALFGQIKTKSRKNKRRYQNNKRTFTHFRKGFRLHFSLDPKQTYRAY